MSSTLSEQIGAMALVDQLRHRELELQEHLDLPRRRAEVAERIRTYYQNSGIRFDDGQIEAGVRQFFEQRLVFEAPALTRRQRLLSTLCLGRDKLLNYAAATAMTLLILLFGFWGWEAQVDDRAARVTADGQVVQAELGVQRKRLEQAKRRLQRQPNDVAADLVAKAERLLPGPFQAVHLDPAEFSERAAFKAQLARTEADLAGVQQNLESVRSWLNRIEHLFASLDRQQQLLARLKAMPLPDAYKKQLRTWINEASQPLATLRLETADATLDSMSGYLDYAARPLALELVDRPGIKSGVERCYEASGCAQDSTQGKSWYLIVEALDAAGKPAFVPVTSVEDNQTRWATQFGVRVSQAEYLRVREDKLDDGHISQRRIGSKSANSLDLRFNQRTSANPDMILEW